MDEFYRGYKIDRNPEAWKGTVVNYDRVENFKQLQERCPGFKIIARYGRDASHSHDCYDYRITNQDEYEKDIKERNNKVAESGPFCGYWGVHNYRPDVV